MDLNLYNYFTKDLYVEVKYIGNVRGKGLFAKKNFNQGDQIFKEDPLVSAQFLWNEFYKYQACEYCLRSLEDAESMARRLSANPNLKLPYKERYETYAIENYIRCPRCEVIFELHTRVSDIYLFKYISCQSRNLFLENPYS